MIEVTSCYKNLNNKAILENISFEIKIKEKICIISRFPKEQEMLIKLLAGLYEPSKGIIKCSNSTFFIPKNINIKNFNIVEEIVDHFLIYYKNANVVKIYNILQESNILRDSKLDSLSLNDIKYLYLVIAINSDVDYIFIEELFDNISNKINEKMKELINVSNSSVIITSNSLQHLDGIITDFIYIKNGQTIKGNMNEVNKNFFKSIVVYSEEFNFTIFKDNIININFTDKTATLLYRDKEVIDSLVYNSNPILHERVPLSISDLNYIGDLL